MVNPFVLAKSWFCTWKLSSRRLISEVKFIKAEFLMDQLSELNSSIETIMARLMYEPTSVLNCESEKSTFMMLKLWILLSSLWSGIVNYSRRKSRVRFNKRVSSDFSTSKPFFLFVDLFLLMITGSERKMAMIVGGIPADLLKIVLWFSD